MINSFTSTQITNEVLTYHCNFVSRYTTQGTNTPEYFRTFMTSLVDNSELNLARNTRKVKYVTIGNKLWNSLTTDFKIGISGRTG